MIYDTSFYQVPWSFNVLFISQDITCQNPTCVCTTLLFLSVTDKSWARQQSWIHGGSRYKIISSHPGWKTQCLIFLRCSLEWSWEHLKHSILKKATSLCSARVGKGQLLCWGKKFPEGKPCYSVAAKTMSLVGWTFKTEPIYFHLSSYGPQPTWVLPSSAAASLPPVCHHFFLDTWLGLQLGWNSRSSYACSWPGTCRIL